MAKEMIIAQELAKKQREISVSEFFTKNRHLLGFDNPTRALLMTVKEAVDNSLTYDMPLMVRSRGKISIVKIGEFIDDHMKQNKEHVNIQRKGDLEKLSLDEKFEVWAFDKKTLKLNPCKVSTLFRHKVNSPIYRVALTSGRYVDLTAYHSIFTLEEGKVVSRPTAELKVGTPIIVPKKSWSGEFSQNEINLVEELLLLDQKLTSRINVYGVNSLLTQEIIDELKNIIPKSKRYRIQDFKKANYLPVNILRKLHFDIKKLDKSKIGKSLSRYKIPVIIRVDENFAELLGLYIAEGSMLKSGSRLHFSFGDHEKDLIYYTSDLFEKVFGFSPKLKRAHRSAYNLVANCTTLCFILKNVLNVGGYANTKKFPILFLASVTI